MGEKKERKKERKSQYLGRHFLRYVHENEHAQEHIIHDDDWKVLEGWKKNSWKMWIRLKQGGCVALGSGLAHYILKVS